MGQRRGVRLLEADPGLALQLASPERERATLALVAAAESLEPGVWDEGTNAVKPAEGALGVLLIEGLMLREVHIAQSHCAELVGEGDVLRPWKHIGSGASVPSEVRWTVLEHATVAYLDRRFLELAAQWPAVIGALAVRAVERAQSLTVAFAIACMTGLNTRMLALLWTLADRWGRVGSDGVHLELPLTHQALARMSGATRPSVSTALKELEREGQLSRNANRGYVLHGDPPEELTRGLAR